MVLPVKIHRQRDWSCRGLPPAAAGGVRGQQGVSCQLHPLAPAVSMWAAFYRQ